MHVLASAPPGSAWTFGGSILTFAFPMILFIVVAVALYVLYTKPEVVPGHQVRPPERSVSYTPMPGTPSAAASGPGTGPAAETSAAETSAAETSADQAGAGQASADETAGTGDAE